MDADSQRLLRALLPERPVRVLSLDQLIAVKAHLQRPKDKIVEAELRSIRARRQSDG